MLPRSEPRSPRESSAPHLIKDSSDFRFKFFDPTRERKSESVVKGPCASRSAIIASEIPSPKFFMDDKPNRMASFSAPTTVKSLPLSFASGGRKRRHSVRLVVHKKL